MKTIWSALAGLLIVSSVQATHLPPIKIDVSECATVVNLMADLLVADYYAAADIIKEAKISLDAEAQLVDFSMMIYENPGSFASDRNQVRNDLGRQAYVQDLTKGCQEVDGVWDPAYVNFFELKS